MLSEVAVATKSVDALAALPAVPAVRPLRLLFAANISRGFETGMGNCLGSLARALERRGHRVDFLLSEDLPAAASAGRFSRLVFPYLLVRELRRRIRRGRFYDVVNVHEPCASLYAAWKSLFNSLPPLVVSSHGVEQRAWELRGDQAKRSLKARLFHPPTELWQANYSLRHANAVACLSSEDAEFLKRRSGGHPSRIHRLSNGVDPALFEIKWSPSARPRLLFIGTWIPRKGTWDLARAFGELRKEYPWLTLTILGSSLPAARVLEDFAPADRTAVGIVPRVGRGDLPSHLAHDQIFVLPSYFEGMPLSLLEAMAAGLPCVTTAACGMLDLVRHGENGLLVPCGDRTALPRELRRLLASAGLRARLGARARETCRHLTWEEVALEWETLFAAVARERPRRFILHENCWSNGAAKESQDRLVDSLVELSEQLKHEPDPCQEMSRWAELDIRGNILDLGCGTGWKTYCLNRRAGNRTVACDYDFRLLEYGRGHFSLRESLQCDACTLPFLPGSFDWVLAIEVIEHLEDPIRFLEEIRRVLRPGGRLLLTTPNRRQYLRPWRPRWFYLGLRGRIALDGSHVREFDADQLQALLPEGLSALRVKFLGTLCGRPRPIQIAQIPELFQKWWAQGLELVVEKVSDL